MELGFAAQWAAFAVMTFISVAGALGMTTTMSMYRSAIFLMASFIGVGGLFILLMADLLGLLQVMMYIGGMLVMALFMVLFSGDPGGAMMTSMMALPAAEKFFSLGLDRSGGENGHDHHDHGDHSDEDGSDEDANGHAHHHGGTGHGDGDEEDEHDGEHDNEQKGSSEEEEEDSDEDGGGGHDEDDGGHDMEPMFIVEQKVPAAILATVVGLGLSAMILLRPAWAVREAIPQQNSAEQIGDLLMNKYMIAFEGAGLLILLGIFGAVFLSRPWRFPDPTGREEIQAAVAEVPAPVETDALEPLFKTDLTSGDPASGNRASGSASREQRSSAHAHPKDHD